MTQRWCKYQIPASYWVKAIPATRAFLDTAATRATSHQAVIEGWAVIDAVEGSRVYMESCE
jgi:hypothetical protein